MGLIVYSTQLSLRCYAFSRVCSVTLTAELPCCWLPRNEAHRLLYAQCAGLRVAVVASVIARASPIDVQQSNVRPHEALSCIALLTTAVVGSLMQVSDLPVWVCDGLHPTSWSPCADCATHLRVISNALRGFSEQRMSSSPTDGCLSYGQKQQKAYKRR